MTSLHPMLSIGQQLGEPLRIHLGLSRSAARKQAAELLDAVRIPDPESALRAFPHQFSGGMRQRVAIAIALAGNPSLLIADEPTTALDVTVQAGIIRLLDRLRRERGLSVILITHDLGVMSSIADRIAVFYAGRVVELGRAGVAREAPAAPVHARAPRRAAASGGAGRHAARADPGMPPAAGAVPTGCAFHPRCAFAVASCTTEVPELVARGRPPPRLPRRPVAHVSVPPSPTARVSVLEIEEIDVTYERRDRVKLKAVVGASLSVERGQIVGLVGESGCGKSSLARAAVGLVAPTAGRIRFEGQDVSALTRRARPQALTRLQLVFQNPYSSLNPRRRVGDQIADGLPGDGSGRSGRTRRVGELLERVGLSAGAAQRFPSQFSGGQRQRIAIARALAADPSLIVLDEPLASLDASAQAQVANLLVALSRELVARPAPDLARSRNRSAHGRRRIGHVPGAHRRDRTDARGLVGAAPSVHRGPDRRRAATRRDRDDARRAAGRGARPRAPADGLPLPPTLPAPLLALSRGGARARAGVHRARRLLLAAARPRPDPTFAQNGAHCAATATNDSSTSSSHEEGVMPAHKGGTA